jgi:mevalonate kinase
MMLAPSPSPEPLSSYGECMQETIARAPGRICLLGDNVDLIEKPALAAAISAFLTVRLRKRQDDLVILTGKDIDFSESFRLDEPLSLSSPLKYLEAGFLRLKERIDCGFKADVTSQIPVGAGLSSSTALSIAFIRALSQAYDIPMTALEIAELSFLTENIDLDIDCGRMDQYAIACGGVTYIDTGPQAGVETIEVESLPIVVGDTREPHDTRQLQKWLRQRLAQGDPALVNPLNRVVKLVEQGRQALLKGDLGRLGLLMNQQQAEELAMGTSTERLEAFCAATRQSGAIGAKQMGAGGGGCMIALCPGNESAVLNAIQDLGGTAWAFEIFHNAVV